MKILVPMAGEGKRFQDAGYRVGKPAVPTYDRHDGKLKPMVVCAVADLPGAACEKNRLIFVERGFHRTDGTEREVRRFFPHAEFLVTEGLTEGQACTCLLAKGLIDDSEELLIAGCDNGMEYDRDAFEQKKREYDVLVFTYRHNEAVLKNPDAYGWMYTDGAGTITDISIKKAISDTPMEDHAVVATFWFREGRMFVEAAEKMIRENDRIKGEFYVDGTVRHAINLGFRAGVFEIGRYICWGTPQDYSIYQNTYAYWKGFLERV